MDMNLSKLWEMGGQGSLGSQRVGLELETEQQQKLNVVIILQYIQISKHYTVHLKLIKFYINNTSTSKKELKGLCCQTK